MMPTANTVLPTDGDLPEKKLWQPENALLPSLLPLPQRNSARSWFIFWLLMCTNTLTKFNCFVRRL
jgi:hypothetical protein